MRITYVNSCHDAESIIHLRFACSEVRAVWWTLAASSSAASSAALARSKSLRKLICSAVKSVRKMWHIKLPKPRWHATSERSRWAHSDTHYTRQTKQLSVLGWSCRRAPLRRMSPKSNSNPRFSVAISSWGTSSTVKTLSDRGLKGFTSVTRTTLSVEK